MTPGVWLVIAGASLVAGMVCGLISARFWLAFTVAGAAAGLIAAATVLLGSPEWEWRSGFPVGGEAMHLWLDGLSGLFLALVSVVGGTGAVYAFGYWPEQEHPDSAARGRVWWNGLLLSMGLLLVMSNGLHFLISWELFTICAYFLITLDREPADARRAGWLYLAASHAGTVCLFAFFATLAARTGSWELGPTMRNQAALAPLFWLALAGFAVKAGLFPLHVWLPAAHANAPSHVSAIMSGVAIKMGVYGILRFSGWLALPKMAGWVMISVGAVSALMGIVFAFAQNDLKRLLAYCSVENIGIIATGLGLAILGATHGDAWWGRLALAGALLHVWNHGAFKSLLFFCAGSVLHATGTREIRRLGGLWRVMPWTAGLFAVGCLAVAGLPPLNGFVSEWLVYLGLFSAAAGREVAGWAAMPAAILLAVAGAMAVAVFVKAGALVFAGQARTKVVADAHECGGWMRGPMVAMAALCVCLGLTPVFIWPVISRVAGIWNPAWTGGGVPPSLPALGWCQWLVALAVVAGAVGLWMAVGRNGLRRAGTWDCGYAQPSAQMQYTGGSFAGIAAGWFRWVLQPERKLRRPRGLLPANATRLERAPETVLEHVIAPVSRALLQVVAEVRRLQHGRLQAYIFYVAVALAAMGVIVWLGGRP